MRAFDDIRRDFPVLSQVIDGKPITYLDSAASAQVPLPVIKAMTDFATTKYANIHRGLYQLSQSS
ncbi:MAG: aminotransferase class V-fold PLP-dependent enzyme, partial [bacterium]|nr:aminotransferase class V-fold PLP-dependent enzyme [bacterium]